MAPIDPTKPVPDASHAAWHADDLQRPMAVRVHGSEPAALRVPAGVRRSVGKSDSAGPTAAEDSAIASEAEMDVGRGLVDLHDFLQLMLGANATIEVQAPDLSQFGADRLQTLNFTTPEGIEPPSVRARVINSAAPQQSVRLQPVQYDTLIGTPATVLNFPRALRRPAVHSILALELMPPDSGYAIFSLHIDVLDPNGTVLAGGYFSKCTAGPTCHDLFLVDVLGQLGMTTNSTGQIRATLTSGTGDLWGFVSAVYPAGNVSAEVGRNP